MQEPPLPDCGCALFFGFDGTLTDIAAQPGAVRVPAVVPQRLSLLVRALGGAVAVISGRAVAEVELKPRRASKGQAVRAFLDERPFRSRRPWVFGDDVTDEVAFETVLGLGGVAVKVGAGESLAPYRLADPAALHDWLQRAVQSLGAARATKVAQRRTCPAPCNRGTRT
ncbi:MAG: trehalose-phosphatase [Rubrivivax sp.]|nr:trehalose-phosphatase [Rubrivivax sp.]